MYLVLTQMLGLERAELDHFFHRQGRGKPQGHEDRTGDDGMHLGDAWKCPGDPGSLGQVSRSERTTGLAKTSGGEDSGP